MGSTSYLTKGKTGARGGYGSYRPTKSGSSIGSDKEINGKLKRTKPRRSGKLGDYGLKRVPDYTELAYKEAVSKLRYFLSGNYAPVYRSYGGSPSIKNLEDSELDIDKKYPVPYTPLKPRLTAKYTQLYADSLDNYSPYASGQAEASKPTPSSQDSATNPEVVHFIQKQEDYIEQLERESQYCRDELNNLLGKVKEVISENEHLHEAQKNKIISRMFDSYGGSETDDLDDVGDSTGLDSDAKVTPSKIRKSTKPARSTRLEGPNIVFESRISELEAHLTQANIDQKKLQDENNENKRKLAEGLVDSSCLDGFKRQIDNLQRDKSTLEAQVAKLKLALDQRDQSDSDLGSRLKRGSDVVEQQLREERNNLEAEVRRLKEELDSQRGKVRELCGEGARRAVQERSAAQQRYTAHLDELAHDLAAQYDNVSKLQLDLERQRRDEQDLKRELSMKTAAIEELKMELKSKTAGLQADLAQAHAEKASLDEELASARLAIERQQRQAKHETNRLNSEIQSLRQRLDRADADLVHSRRENLRLSEEIAKLEKDIKLGNLTPTSPIKDNKEKELSSMIVSMENKHAHTVAELEAMIQSQNGLMDKLTGECRLLTDKLDDASRRHKQSAESQPNRATNQNTVRRLKHQRTADSPFFQAPRKRVRFVEQEMAALQRQVDGISQTFHQPAPNLLANNYQAPPTHKPLAENISPVAAFTRNDNTRTDTTRDPKIKRQSSNSSIRGDGDDPTRTIRKQPSNELFSVGHADKVSVDNQNYADNQRQPPDKFEEKLDEATEKHEPKYSTGTYSTENHEDPNPLAETNQVYSEEPQYATDQSYDTDQNDYNQQPFESQPDTYGTQENQQLYESQPDTYGTQETPYTETYNQEQANYEGTDPVNYAQDYTQGQYANQEYPAQYAEQQNEGYTEQPYDYSTDPNYQNPINQNTLDPNYENQVNPEYENTADSNYQNPVDLNYQNPVDPNYNTQDQSYGATENYLATEQQYVENTNTGIANNSPNKIQS